MITGKPGSPCSVRRDGELRRSPEIEDSQARIDKEADVRLYIVTVARGDPSAVTPHSLRHSVAWRMLNAEGDTTMYDLRNLLRHRSIRPTGRVYDHIDEI